MELLEDFQAFLDEYEIPGLAIAFVIGVAVKDLVSATVDDLIMPVVSLFLQGGDWESATLVFYGAELRVGHFLGAFLDFLIVALLVFGFVRYVLKREEVGKI